MLLRIFFIQFSSKDDYKKNNNNNIAIFEV